MREFTAEKFIELWQEAEDGSAHYPPHSVYQYVTAQYPQMGKSNAALYESMRVLEEVHGWKLDLDNVVWDVPTFIERRKTIRKWEHTIPDEIQRNAGNRSWQTEDNAIVGEELETGSFEHKHVIMTIPSKHRLDKLISDVCTSQMVVERTDVHNQISYVALYTIARGQLDRNAHERTPSLGRLTIGKLPDYYWADYLTRKKNYFDKRRKTNYEHAQTILTEATTPRSSFGADEIEALLLEKKPQKCRKYPHSTEGFSVTKTMIWLKENGYGELPYARVQRGTAQANAHENLTREAEKAEEAT